MVSDNDDDDDDDDDDDTEALMAELEQIKKERAEEKLRLVIYCLISNPSEIVFPAFLNFNQFFIVVLKP